MIEFRIGGGESGVSQVSERVKISIFWSLMKSSKAAGLFSSAVIEAMERVLRCESVMEGVGL